MEWTQSSFSVSGNVNPEWIQSGVITERLEWREERALIHSRLWSHPPQQTEYTSSFLHLTPIQAKIKTFITLFEKCKHIYSLKWWKVNLRRRELCNWRESVISTENFRLWETRELMQRTGGICGGRCVYCGWLLLSHHILLVLQFLNLHA